MEAYLDIETTGLSPWDCQIIVVGIHRCNGDETDFVQIVGKDIKAHSILDALNGVSVLYTYNGSRFDLPFIHSRLGINLEEMFEHRDLMYDCWRCNLYGGFKGVEKQLGIQRKLTEVNGYEAVKLWYRYVDSFDLSALQTLLEYNKEDVLNLKVLKDKLLLTPTPPHLIQILTSKYQYPNNFQFSISNAENVLSALAGDDQPASNGSLAQY